MPRDVRPGIGLCRASVNDRDGFAPAYGLVEVPGIHFVSELALVVVQLIGARFDRGGHNPSPLGTDACAHGRLPFVLVDRQEPATATLLRA